MIPSLPPVPRMPTGPPTSHSPSPTPSAGLCHLLHGLQVFLPDSHGLHGDRRRAYANPGANCHAHSDGNEDRNPNRNPVAATPTAPLPTPVVPVLGTGGSGPGPGFTPQPGLYGMALLIMAAGFAVMNAGQLRSRRAVVMAAPSPRFQPRLECLWRRSPIPRRCCSRRWTSAR